MKLIQKFLGFTFVFCAYSIHAQLSTDIRVNQIGFYPKGPKSAAIINSNASTFTIKSVDRTKTFFSGVLSVSSTWSQSGESVKTADFSAFDIPGVYVVDVPSLGYSYSFKIANNIFTALNKAAIRAYYYNRASTELFAVHAGKWARKAGHLDNEVIILPSSSSTGRPAGTKISSPKGWYDAGDYNCYVVNSGISTYQLMSAYEQFKTHYDTLKLNIPESNNTTPDILDEVRWNLDWLLTMQDPYDGGVYHKKTNASFGSINEMPERALTPRYMTRKTTAAALNFSAVMAFASRIYKNTAPNFANTCLEASKKAYVWAKANPSISYVEPTAEGIYPAINTGPYESSNVADEFDWAANELYISTKNDTYYEDGFKNTKNYGLPRWAEVSSLGLISLIQNRKTLTPRGLLDTTNMKTKLLNQANVLLTYQKNTSPYKIVMGSDGNRDFSWGSNSNSGNKGVLLMNAYRITNNKEYLNAAISGLDYLLGKNAVGYSFVTGSGSKKFTTIHHRPSLADAIVEPVPGWLVGGPSGFFGNPDGTGGDGCPYDLTYLAKSIQDADCYSKTEVTINWNSPLVYLTSALEVYNKNVISGIESETSTNQESVSIYPNPNSSGYLNLSRESNFTVYSVLGQELLRGQGKEIQLLGYPKGVYMIQLGDKMERVVLE